MKDFYCPHGGSEQMLANGRSLAQGERFKLTKEDLEHPHNKRMVAEGHILEVPAAAKTESKGDKS